MILVRDIRLPLSAGEPQAFEKALHLARVPRAKVGHLGVAKLSVDARHGQPKLVYTVAVTLKDEGEESAYAGASPCVALHQKVDFSVQNGTRPLVHRPVVCGLGPAGLFAALLLARQGILCERKSVYSDIEALNALGYDIQLKRGRHGGYWMASRTFDLAELKLLVDAVQSSRVISKSTSDKLIKKLEGLTSHYEGSQLQRQVYVDGRPKSANKDLPYSVDALFSAINKGRMVQFRYKKVGRPETRTISPWQMVWENGCYYLIAYQDEKSPVGIRHYRVDKMAGVLVLDAPRRGKAQFAGFDLPSYLKKHFNMYGGPEHSVTLRCTADLEPAMRERFGTSPILIPEGETHFHFTVPICVSDQFYGWVCGFGGKVEITAPAAVRSGLQEMTSRIAQAHQPV